MGVVVVFIRGIVVFIMGVVVFIMGVVFIRGIVVILCWNTVVVVRWNYCCCIV